MVMILERSYLCPEGHVTDSSTQCDCGESNLVNLGRVLNRQTDEAKDPE